MATKTLKASAAFSAVAREAEKIKNDALASVELSPGDVLRQGDLYILRLDREIPGGKPAGTHQLAPGTTQGSRHVAEGDCDVLTVLDDKAIAAVNRLIPSTKGQTLFVGPMIRARGTITITHPEHGHRTIGEGCYLVTVQRTWANEIRRTAD